MKSQDDLQEGACNQQQRSRSHDTGPSTFISNLNDQIEVVNFKEESKGIRKGCMSEENHKEELNH